jgi:hypothetical protein
MSVPLELRDVRIRGVYTPEGSATSRTVDRQFRLAGAADANGIVTSITNTAIKQDVTPTYTQAQAGEAGFNVVSPTASDAFASATGTHGLEESSDQPGDLTRLFYGTVDGSRAHHMACHRVGPYTASGRGVVAFTGGTPSGILTATTIQGITETGNVNSGVIVQEAASKWGYYTFNRTAGEFQRYVTNDAWDIRPTSFSVPGAGPATANAANLVMFRQIAGKIWLPVSGVSQLKDLFNPASTVATDNPVSGYFVLGDRLHAFAYVAATGNVELYPYDIASNGALTRTQNSVPATSWARSSIPARSSAPASRTASAFWRRIAGSFRSRSMTRTRSTSPRSSMSCRSA